MQNLAVRAGKKRELCEFWDVNMSQNDKIQFLKDNKGLQINNDGICDFIVTPTEKPDVQFYAGRDAVIVFNTVKKKGNQIIDIDFSILARNEFRKFFRLPDEF